MSKVIFELEVVEVIKENKECSAELVIFFSVINTTMRDSDENGYWEQIMGVYLGNKNEVAYKDLIKHYNEYSTFRPKEDNIAFMNNKKEILNCYQLEAVLDSEDVDNLSTSEIESFVNLVIDEIQVKYDDFIRKLEILNMNDVEYELIVNNKLYK